MAEVLYDVIIIGGGPAGLTAGIYTSRQMLKTILLEGAALGGRAFGAHLIYNFPGFPEGISGEELMDRFIAQANKFGVDFREESVVELQPFGDLKMVVTRKGIYNSKSIIIATGVQRKQLKVPGETEFKGRGVSYCSICDGPLFKGKAVAVIGSGTEAIEEASRMAGIAEKVYAIPGTKGYRVNEEKLNQLALSEKVEFIEDVNVESIGGDVFVTNIKLSGDPPRALEVEGVFVSLENVPTTDIIRDAGITTNVNGCIIVDSEQRTNVEGVFAAGDCCCGGMQIVIAAGDGGRAGLSVLRYIKSKQSIEK